MAASSSASGGLDVSYRPALGKLHAYEIAVCQIVQTRDNVRGTGFLIGPTLVMTCNHVVPNLETAKKCQAHFFKDPVYHPDLIERSTHTYDQLEFDTSDPDKFLFSPQNRDEKGNVREVIEGKLDYSILFLKEHPAFARRQFFQLFRSIIPKEGRLTYLYQHPEKDSIDVSTGLTFKGDFAMGAGSIVKVGEHEVHYVAPAAEGSSGGPVVDASGNLIALHYQGKIGDYEGHEPHYSAHKCSRPSGHTSCNAGVRLDKIVESLDETAKAQIKAWIAEGEAFYESLATSLKILAGKIFELPDPHSDFTGREKELEALKKLCQAKGRVVISGLGGVGKTATVLQYAHEQREKYSFIHFIRCLPGPAQEEPSGAAASSSSAAASTEEEVSFKASITEGLLALASDLKLPGSNSKEQLRALKRHLREMEEEFLLIFDGVDDTRAFEEIKSYLPSRENGKCIVVTSRLSAPIEGFSPLDLQPFSPEDAAAYLLKTVSDPDAQQATLLAKELGYLPLALKHAAAYIQNAVTISTFKEYLELYKGEGIKLQGPKYMRLTTEKKTILTTWNISLNAIAEKCGSSITLAGFLASLAPAPIPTIVIKQWFKAHLAPSALEFERALGYLRAYSFVGASSGLCHIHTLVQQVIRLNFPEGHYQSCLREALGDFASLVHTLNPEIPEDRKALASFIPHCEVICLNLENGSFPSDEGPGIRLLLNRLWGFHQYGGKYKEALGYAKRGKEISMRQDGRKSAEVARSLNNMGGTLRALGRYEEALQCLQEALELRREILGTKHLFVATSLDNVGTSLGDLGRYKEALRHKQEALELRRELFGPKHPHVATSLNNVGSSLGDLGRYEEAFDHLQETLELIRELFGPKHPHVALTLNNMGIVLENLGRNEEALQYLQEALELTRELFEPKHPHVALALNNVGFPLGKLGRNEEALQYLQEALELRREVLGPKHPDVAISLNNVGSSLGDLGRHEEALEYLQEAVKLGEEIFGPCHRTTSIFCQQLQGYSQMLEHKATLETSQQLGMSLDSGGYNSFKKFKILGLGYRKKGDQAHAYTYLKKAIGVLDRSACKINLEEVAHVLNVLGNACRSLKKFDESYHYLSKALAIRLDIYPEPHIEIVKTLNNLGLTFVQKGKIDFGRASLIKALEQAQRLPEKDRQLPNGRDLAIIIQNNLIKISSDVDSKRAASSSSAAAPDTSTAYDDKGKGKHPDQATSFSDESDSAGE